EGLNITEKNLQLKIGESYQIETNLISNHDDKTIKFESQDESVASVDKKGVVTGNQKGKTEILVFNEASGYEAVVNVIVKKDLEIGYTIPQYDLDDRHLSVVEKDPDNLKGRRY